MITQAALCQGHCFRPQTQTLGLASTQDVQTQINHLLSVMHHMAKCIRTPFSTSFCVLLLCFDGLC